MLSEFERQKWERRSQAENHEPVMAAKAVVDKIERGEFKNVKHVVVLVIEEIDGDLLLSMSQAGTLSEFAIEGALGRAIRMQAEKPEHEI